MTKYRSYERGSTIRYKEPHPIWRGIGCLLMLIVPVISLALSFFLVEVAIENGVPIPRELLGFPNMPTLLFRVPGLVDLLLWIEGRENLYAILISTFMLVVLLGGVLALSYAIVYRLVGPPRYSPLDAPPVNIRVRRYKR